MNNLQNYVSPINPLIRIEYHGEPVLTTEQLADALTLKDNFGIRIGRVLVTPDHIRHNFRNNKAYFEEGKHFFKLEGDELKAFRDSMKEIHVQIPVMTRTLYLWTKRGVARHCKSVNSEMAWKIFEDLEDTYFKVEEILRENLTVDKFKQADLLCRMSSHEKDPYTKKRLTAEAARLILGKDFASKQTSLF